MEAKEQEQGQQVAVVDNGSVPSDTALLERLRKVVPVAPVTDLNSTYLEDSRAKLDRVKTGVLEASVRTLNALYSALKGQLPSDARENMAVSLQCLNAMHESMQHLEHRIALVQRQQITEGVVDGALERKISKVVLKTMLKVMHGMRATKKQPARVSRQLDVTQGKKREPVLSLKNLNNGEQAPRMVWTCTQCSFDRNGSDAQMCELCGSNRAQGVRIQEIGGSSTNRARWTCLRCMHADNAPSAPFCGVCSAVNPTQLKGGQSGTVSAEEAEQVAGDAASDNLMWVCHRCGYGKNYVRTDVLCRLCDVARLQKVDGARDNERGQGWLCHVCGFGSNLPMLNACSICEAPRDLQARTLGTVDNEEGKGSQDKISTVHVEAYDLLNRVLLLERGAGRSGGRSGDLEKWDVEKHQSFAGANAVIKTEGGRDHPLAGDVEWRERGLDAYENGMMMAVEALRNAAMRVTNEMAARCRCRCCGGGGGGADMEGLLEYLMAVSPVDAIGNPVKRRQVSDRMNGRGNVPFLQLRSSRGEPVPVDMDVTQDVYKKARVYGSSLYYMQSLFRRGHAFSGPSSDKRGGQSGTTLLADKMRGEHLEDETARAALAAAYMQVVPSGSGRAWVDKVFDGCGGSWITAGLLNGMARRGVQWFEVDPRTRQTRSLDQVLAAADQELTEFIDIRVAVQKFLHDDGLRLLWRGSESGGTYWSPSVSEVEEMVLHGQALRNTRPHMDFLLENNESYSSAAEMGGALRAVHEGLVIDLFQYFNGPDSWDTSDRKMHRSVSSSDVVNLNRGYVKQVKAGNKPKMAPVPGAEGNKLFDPFSRLFVGAETPVTVTETDVCYIAHCVPYGRLLIYWLQLLEYIARRRYQSVQDLIDNGLTPLMLMLKDREDVHMYLSEMQNQRYLCAEEHTLSEEATKKGEAPQSVPAERVDVLFQRTGAGAYLLPILKEMKEEQLAKEASGVAVDTEAKSSVYDFVDDRKDSAYGGSDTWSIRNMDTLEQLIIDRLQVSQQQADSINTIVYNGEYHRDSSLNEVGWQSCYTQQDCKWSKESVADGGADGKNYVEALQVLYRQQPWLLWSTSLQYITTTNTTTTTEIITSESDYRLCDLPVHLQRKAEEHYLEEYILFSIKAINVEKQSIFNDTNPMLEIFRRYEHIWDRVYRSPERRNARNPEWNGILLNVKTLCACDPNRKILFRLVDNNGELTQAGTIPVIGEFVCTYNDILRGTRRNKFPLISREKREKTGKAGFWHGSAGHCYFYHARDLYRFDRAVMSAVDEFVFYEGDDLKDDAGNPVSPSSPLRTFKFPGGDDLKIEEGESKVLAPRTPKTVAVNPSTAHSKESAWSEMYVNLKLSCEGLPRKLGSKPSAFLEFCRLEGHRWKPVFNTQTVIKSDKPNYSSFVIPSTVLCSRNVDQPIMINCWNDHCGAKTNLMGSFITTLRELMKLPSKAVVPLTRNREVLRDKRNVLEAASIPAGRRKSLFGGKSSSAVDEMKATNLDEKQANVDTSNVKNMLLTSTNPHLRRMARREDIHNTILPATLGGRQEIDPLAWKDNTVTNRVAVNLVELDRALTDSSARAVEAKLGAALIQLELVAAKDLKKLDLFSESDPYCRVDIMGVDGFSILNKQQRDLLVTPVIEDTNYPVWDKRFDLFTIIGWDLLMRAALVDITVFDKDAVSSTHIGSVCFSVDFKKMRDGKDLQAWFKLTDKEGHVSDRGSMNVRLVFSSEERSGGSFMTKMNQETLTRNVRESAFPFNYYGENKLPVIKDLHSYHGARLILTKAATFIDIADVHAQADRAKEDSTHPLYGLNFIGKARDAAFLEYMFHGQSVETIFPKSDNLLQASAVKGPNSDGRGVGSAPDGLTVDVDEPEGNSQAMLELARQRRRDLVKRRKMLERREAEKKQQQEKALEFQRGELRKRFQLEYNFHVYASFPRESTNDRAKMYQIFRWRDDDWELFEQSEEKRGAKIRWQPIAARLRDLVSDKDRPEDENPVLIRVWERVAANVSYKLVGDVKLELLKVEAALNAGEVAVNAKISSQRKAAYKEFTANHTFDIINVEEMVENPRTYTSSGSLLLIPVRRKVKSQMFSTGGQLDKDKAKAKRAETQGDDE